MANNKMLIDASHPEETRVAVVRGNRIEEFDFESQAKKQLRGNIYLAKVTRVEPSLQAAFVDYGGNRHGFLAFSEIHPDYYQIPMADRQALLEEEARQTRESADKEEAETKPSRSRRSEKSKEKQADSETDETSPTAEEDADGEADEDRDEEDGRTIAAVIETDSISEPAPDKEPEDGGSQGNESECSDKSSGEPMRKTKRASRKPKKAKAETAEDESGTDDAAEADQATGSAEASSEASDAEAKDNKEQKRSGRKRRSRRGGKSARDKSEAQETKSEPDNAEEIEEGDVESVGQEDALEEVPHRRNLRRQYNIQEVIKRRQIMLVQVVKEERGNKGAALTTYLSLAGRYSVLMPNTARGGGISRKITNANDRKRLKAIAGELDVQQGMGVILRTAGASRTKAEIKRDFEYLMRLWETVRSLTLTSTAPCLVYEEGSLIKRSIRDLYNKDIGEVIVAGDNGYKEAKEFMRMLMPSHAKNVKPYQEDQPIFSRSNVEQQLDQLLTPQVTLKSGGYLVINQTEALVSIDVNSGRSTREHSIENTAVQTNLEAADEIARQLRLRDLAGLIVIDFIDMEEKRNNRAVEKRLKEALKNDRARIQVGRISHFGLMEMSRQRIRASVMESTMDVCPHCGGTGHVRSDSSIALHVYRAIEDHLNRHQRHDVVVRCPTTIALDLLNAKRIELGELETRFGVRITVQGDNSLPGQSFAIERGEKSAGGPPASGHVHPDSTATEHSDDSGDSTDRSDDAGNRGKRGRSDRDSHEKQQAASDEREPQDQSDEDGHGSDDGAEGSRRRRRRGKRGGRRNRRQDNDGSAEGDAERQNKHESDKEPQSEIAASKKDDKQQERSGPDIEAPEKSKNAAQTTAEEKSEAETARASNRGRNTRRPRKTGSDDAAEEAALQSAESVASEAAAGTETSVSEKSDQDKSEAEEPKKSKRGGWWSRGGNFF